MPRVGQGLFFLFCFDWPDTDTSAHTVLFGVYFMSSGNCQFHFESMLLCLLTSPPLPVGFSFYLFFVLQYKCGQRHISMNRLTINVPGVLLRVDVIEPSFQEPFIRAEFVAVIFYSLRGSGFKT